jgi:endoglucanase
MFQSSLVHYLSIPLWTRGPTNVGRKNAIGKRLNLILQLIPDRTIIISTMDNLQKTISILFIAFACLLVNHSCKSDSDPAPAKPEIPTPEPEEPVAPDTLPVIKYGQLQVVGNRIVDYRERPVQLRGMSLFWSQWIGKYYNADAVKWLKEDWHCNVIRAAMAVENDGYLTNPAFEKEKVETVVDAAIAEGIYVIIDWHDHHAFNNTQEAKIFFAQMAQQYGNQPNVIYEIFNEPEQVSWSAVIKPYHQSIIDTIRQYDPDNLIICGTSTWSQDVDIAANDPLEGTNIAYTLHFYSGTHKQFLRDKAKTALNKGIALMVTEFGTTDASGDGAVDQNETALWWQFLDENKISWCNWSIADKIEGSAALRPGASPTGSWTDANLTLSGSLIRNEIRTKNPDIKQ